MEIEQRRIHDNDSRPQFSGKENGRHQNKVTLAHVAFWGSISPCAFGNLVYSLPEHELVFISTVLLLL